MVILRNCFFLQPPKKHLDSVKRLWSRRFLQSLSSVFYPRFTVLSVLTSTPAAGLPVRALPFSPSIGVQPLRLFPTSRPPFCSLSQPSLHSCLCLSRAPITAGGAGLLLRGTSCRRGRDGLCRRGDAPRHWRGDAVAWGEEHEREDAFDARADGNVKIVGDVGIGVAGLVLEELFEVDECPSGENTSRPGIAVDAEDADLDSLPQLDVARGDR